MDSDIHIPERLFSLLDGHELRGPIETLKHWISKILGDNKLPFFPAYTDHGINHINAVLETAAILIPDDILNNHLSSEDSAVLIAATLLHDFALYITEPGFNHLVEGQTGHKPISWYREQLGELDWQIEWLNFVRQAKRFSDAELSLIFGPCLSEQTALWTVRDLPADTREWNMYDRLLVGEFIRKNHARIAHEIVLFGFPGLSKRDNLVFDSLGDYRDLIGVVARSHGLPIRRSLEYLRNRYGGNLRPCRTLPLFLMTVLRIADYLQMDKKRAPAVLLDLRRPQSLISIDEWLKQETVVDISYDHIDPEAIHIEVGTQHSLSIHLQLTELIQNLQRELDLSSAVLSEAYGRLIPKKFSFIQLAKSRVCSNIDSPELREQLPYVPVSAKFRVDPNLLVLLVEPLYGDNPGIAIRELVQNAVDAVRERLLYCQKHQIDNATLSFRDLPAHVVVELIKDEHGTWTLRCSDNGIGMDLETITGYFLRAGASYRNNPEWRTEFTDDTGCSSVARSGRFGIGVFSIFLIGNEFEVETRPITDNTGFGFAFMARNNQDLLEIRRAKLPHGTSICVKLLRDVGMRLFNAAKDKCWYPDSDEENDQYNWNGDAWDWYAMDFPQVKRFIIHPSKGQKLIQTLSCPGEGQQIRSARWHRFSSSKLREIMWTYDNYPQLVCNGIIVPDGSFDWKPTSFETKSLRAPRVSVVDHDMRLPLTLDRSQLTRTHAGFEDELLADVEMDIVAHLLATAPTVPAFHSLSTKWSYLPSYPLIDNRLKSMLEVLPLSWVTSTFGIVPFLPNLLQLINFNSIVLYGAPGNARFRPLRSLDVNSLLCPVAISESNVGTLLRALAEFDRGSFAGMNGITGIKLRIISDAAKLSFTNHSHGLTTHVCTIKGRHVYDIEIGRFSKDSFDMDCQNIIEKTFRKGLCAMIANIYGVKAKAKGKSAIAKIWTDVVGGPFLPFEPKAREKVYSRVKEFPILEPYFKRWMAAVDAHNSNAKRGKRSTQE
jgi:molecular chaperone HtpG